MLSSSPRLLSLGLKPAGGRRARQRKALGLPQQQHRRNQAARPRNPRCSTNREEDLRTRGEDGSSSYSSTAAPAKMLVGGLTALVNGVSALLKTDGVSPAQELELEAELPPIPVNMLLATLEADYTERNYLWTGDIEPSVYASDCVFTDPTLSFQGLSTFQRNVANLQPVLNALVSESSTELHCIRSIDREACIEAEWRMVGRFRLPWKPMLKLDGRTKFTYSKERGNRVVRYDEFWQLSAKDALLQLVTPCE